MTANFGTELRQLLAKLSGFSIDATDYVSYFVNDCGERLVFVQRQGEGSATLLHSDLGWEPRPVDGPTTTMAEAAPEEMKQMLKNVSVDGGLLSIPMCGSTILSLDEAKWLEACYSASAPLRAGDDA
ncbi:hypothetical protein [Streptomyces sp. I05A-00742]|uniref:hypothetical protein n=1 Tax=Streptomyces sp. I05A-00742 TaxID=2732853 RepID=UPI001489450F|nr:hypothetical protein [Streptomyces sp. I05A-00742]